MTERMNLAQYREYVGASSVSPSGRVVPVAKPAVKDSLTPAKPNKYGAEKAVVDGILFDSKHEAHCWHVLRMMEQAGQITGLKRQVPFHLHTNGLQVCSYKADFEWWTGDRLHVGDAKGFRTPLYRLKKKMFEAEYGIEIQEM